MRINQAELAVARVVGVSKNIIKGVNLDLGALYKIWQEKEETQSEAITKLTKTN